MGDGAMQVLCVCSGGRGAPKVCVQNPYGDNGQREEQQIGDGPVGLHPHHHHPSGCSAHRTPSCELGSAGRKQPEFGRQAGPQAVARPAGGRLPSYGCHTLGMHVGLAAVGAALPIAHCLAKSSGAQQLSLTAERMWQRKLARNHLERAAVEAEQAHHQRHACGRGTPPPPQILPPCALLPLNRLGGQVGQRGCRPCARSRPNHQHRPLPLSRRGSQQVPARKT